MTYQLLGGEVSYYTGKARAYLRFKGIPFEETLAVREVYKNVIIPRVGWPVVPVVITPEDETLQDTTVIIDALEERIPDPAIYPAGVKQKLVALLLEGYGDEWLKLPAMHYRWNHCYEWILGEFGKLSAPELSPEEQLVVGRKNAGRFHGSLPFLGVHEENGAAIEASYEAFLLDFDAHLNEHPFLLGTRPSIGDFGLMGPLYAHLYRDPYPGDLMRRIAPNVAHWVKRLREDRQEDGEFLANDEVPATLEPILERWAQEYVPVLRGTAAQMKQWANENRHEGEGVAKLPRVIGSQSFTLLGGQDGEATADRAIFPYDLWMLQRSLDHVNSLAPAVQGACRELLATWGVEDLLELEFPRLEMANFKLVCT